MRAARLLLAATLVRACAPPPAPRPPPSPPQAPLSFAADVQPILERSCVEGCHVSGASGPNSLEARSAYQELVDAPSREVPLLDRVEPGQPELSYLIFKLRGRQGQVGGMGTAMPPDGELPQEDFDIIFAWIVQGAPP